MDVSFGLIDFLAAKPPAVWVHFTAASLSLLLGAAVLLRRKGTGAHRLTGRIYAATMLITAGSGFFIYDNTGGISFFHGFSVWSFVSITGGLLTIRAARRAADAVARNRHVENHYHWMAWSYAGLLLAGCAQVLLSFPQIGAQTVLGLTGNDLEIGIMTVAALICMLFIYGWARPMKRRYFPVTKPPA